MLEGIENIVFYNDDLQMLEWNCEAKGGRVSYRKPILGFLKDGRLLFKYQGTLYVYHEVIWSVTHGKIPEGMKVVPLDGNPKNTNRCNIELVEKNRKVPTDLVYLKSKLYYCKNTDNVMFLSNNCAVVGTLRRNYLTFRMNCRQYQLHAVKWMLANDCEIPKGYCVAIRDGYTSNIALDNLQLIKIGSKK